MKMDTLRCSFRSLEAGFFRGIRPQEAGEEFDLREASELKVNRLTLLLWIDSRCHGAARSFWRPTLIVPSSSKTARWALRRLKWNPCYACRICAVSFSAISLNMKILWRSFSSSEADGSKEGSRGWSSLKSMLIVSCKVFATQRSDTKDTFIQVSLCKVSFHCILSLYSLRLNACTHKFDRPSPISDEKGTFKCWCRVWWFDAECGSQYRLVLRYAKNARFSWK